MRAVPAIDQATAITAGNVQVNGHGTAGMIGVDPVTFGPMWRFHWLKGGSDALLGHLATGQALVEEQFATKYGLAPGKHFAALGQTGRAGTLHRDRRVPRPAAAHRVHRRRELVRPACTGQPARPRYVIATTSVSPAAAKAAVASALRSFPTAKVQTKSEYTASISKQVDQLLTLIYALLAVSVIISIFGIINTLVLSIYERTREIGMLRAIGTTRRQMRRIVRYESVITSVIGGILGTILGVLFAYVVSTRLASQGITFSVPWVQLVAFLVVAGIVGVVAAVLPAHRAARVNILDAIHYE